jgi:hypothetical protein
MRDCPNAEMRDLLPDLVHGKLDAEARQLVLAHLAECGDCVEERALLASLLASRTTPSVDTREILAAIGRPPARRAPAAPVASVRPGRAFGGWRAAAAIAAVSLGAIAVGSSRMDRESAAVATSALERAGPAAAPVTPAAGTSAGPSSLGMPLADVSATELEALLGALETMEALPPDAEPMDDIVGDLS